MIMLKNFYSLVCYMSLWTKFIIALGCKFEASLSRSKYKSWLQISTDQYILLISTFVIPPCDCFLYICETNKKIKLAFVENSVLRPILCFSLILILLTGSVAYPLSFSSSFLRNAYADKTGGSDSSSSDSSSSD